MRALFFALVLANIAFFGWAHWVDAPEIASAPAQEKAVPMLSLASNAPGRAEASQRCRTLGPFTTQASAQSAAAALRLRGIATRDRSVERSVEDGYWVYIADLGSGEFYQPCLSASGQSLKATLLPLAPAPASPAALPSDVTGGSGWSRCRSMSSQKPR